MSLADVVQIVGAIFILVPFAWQQLGSLDATVPAYLWPNLIGSAILAVLAASGRDWGFLLLEVVWAAVALRGLLLGLRRRPAPAAG